MIDFHSPYLKKLLSFHRKYNPEVNKKTNGNMKDGQTARVGIYIYTYTHTHTHTQRNEGKTNGKFLGRRVRGDSV
jgi:hypothetical protein